MSGAAGRAGAHRKARAQARMNHKVGRIISSSSACNEAAPFCLNSSSTEGLPEVASGGGARAASVTMADDDDVIEMDDDENCYDVLGTGAVMKEIIREAPDVERFGGWVYRRMLALATYPWRLPAPPGRP